MHSQALPIDWLFQPGKWLAELLASLKARLWERRQVPRWTVPHLAANYLDGTASARHVVKDISLAGAFIFADFKWLPGTVVTMTLDLRGGRHRPPPVVLRAKVVRCAQDGMGVQFVFLSKEGETDLRGFCCQHPRGSTHSLWGQLAAGAMRRGIE